MNFVRKKEQKLARRFVLLVMICSLLVLIFSLGIELFIGYRNSLNRIQESIDFIQDSYVPSINNALFEVDKEQLELLLKGIGKLEEVEYCEVIEAVNQKVLMVSEGKRPAVGTDLYEFPLSYSSFEKENFKIGKLVVYLNDALIHDKTWGDLTIKVFSYFLLICLLSVMITVLFQRSVARHLFDMAEFTSKIDLKKLESRFKLDRHSRRQDELEEVTDSLNSLLDRLKQEFEYRIESEKKVNNAELKQIEAVRAANIGLWDWDLKKNKVQYSNEWKKQIGYKPHEIGDDFKEWKNRVHPEDLPKTFTYIKKQISERRDGFKIEFRFQHKDGHYIWIFSQATILKDDTGIPIRTLGSHLDITERKQSELEIVQSEIKYRSIFENKGTGTGTFGEDGIITSVNSKITELTGYTEDEIVGRMKWSDFVDENDLSKLLSYHSERTKIVDNPPPTEYECTVIHKNGTRKNVVVNIGITDDLRIVSLIDITERVKTEQALIESEGRFRALHNASFSGIAIHKEGIILECNRGLSEMTGYDYKELIGMNGLLQLFSDNSRDYVYKNINIGYEKPYEADGIRKNGEIYPVMLEARNIPYKGENVRVVEFRDLTDMKRMEAQLQQSQKMEAIGTLAGGIAHDFNNILSGIFGYSQLAEMNIDNPERAKSDIRNIVKGASRATELVQQILTFSRKADYEKQYLNLFVIVKEVLKLIRSTIPVSIEINEKINSKASIYADPIQMHQVIMNLCTNAYHAMGDSGGALTVRLDETYMPLQNNESVINVDQKYLELEISDTGHGMDKSTMMKIFDPYFTTKSMEKGTGLGLALVKAIVEGHGGTIQAKSIVNKGSTFLLHFPVSEKKENTNNENNFEKKIPTGTESILFVDDEMGIRSFVQDFLSKYGYAVTVSKNGHKAYEKFKETPQDFDIVITDMAMPKMNGDELSLKILKIRKDIPIILCTGYTEKLTKEQAKEIGITRYIDKPLAGKELCFLIREVLDKAKHT